MQRALRRRSSFWRALLGAVTGLLAGAFVIYCLWRLDMNMAAELWALGVAGVPAPITTGAVLGSGWKAKPVNDTALDVHDPHGSLPSPIPRLP